MRLSFAPYTLHFRHPAGTSRGILHDKQTYLIKVWDENDPTRYGLGEAALFKGLSAEDNNLYEYKLIELLANVAIGRKTDLSRHSSIAFGFEQALMDFAGGCKGIYRPSPFTQGEQSIEINGLVWMGTYEEMLGRIEEKVDAGFKCLKLKIGAIDWYSEVSLIEGIRKRFGADSLTIRVDANGGFTMDNALPRMARLASLGVHSIEQPIPAGHPELMAFLCQVSPLPIALDEELIGVSLTAEKKALLDTVRPRYIILKPALCGGFSGAAEWIDLANERGIGWWITSALESNIGLSALAQWTAPLGVGIPQGLGTGALYTNNFPTPLRLDGDRLSYDPETAVNRSFLDNLTWRE